jgi:outer membrane protein TolC
MFSRFILLFLVGLISLAAQSLDAPKQPAEPTAPWFGSREYVRQVFSPHIPLLQLRGPVKLEDYLAGDKLEISLKNYLELVMANNVDIDLQRITIEAPTNQITRAFSVFDPLIATSFNATRSNTPSNDLLAGAATVSSLSQPFSLGYQQTLSTGLQVSSSFGWTKISNNSVFQTVNPAYNSTWQLGFTQPLLRNRGREITRLPITIARSRLKVAQFSADDQIIRLLLGAEIAYWNVIDARESLAVQEKGLQLADQSLKRTMRELELGATSPLEVFQPQQVYATAEIAVTQAKYRLQQAEDTLRRQMGADLSARFRDVPIVLTESVAATDDKPLEKEKLVELALQRRPDLRAQRQDLDVDDLNIKNALNGLKPLFSLTGGYTAQGVGGNLYERPFDATSDVAPTLVSTGGLGNSLGQLFGFGFPVYAMGLRLSFPLRDRRAAADYADALTQRKLDALQVRQFEQNVRLDVLTAISQAENSKASVKLAQIAVDFANKRLEADQKRYDLGTINIFFLLDSQNALVNAQAQLVSQTLQHRRDIANLLQRTGQLLEERNIVIQP